MGAKFSRSKDLDRCRQNEIAAINDAGGCLDPWWRWSQTVCTPHAPILMLHLHLMELKYTPLSTTTTMTATTITATNAICLTRFEVGQVVQRTTTLLSTGYTVVVVSAEPLLLGLPQLGTSVFRHAVHRRLNNGIIVLVFHYSKVTEKSQQGSTTSRHRK
jgi:hypothetical protein